MSEQISGQAKQAYGDVAGDRSVCIYLFFIFFFFLCLTSFFGASEYPRFVHKGLAMSYLTTLTIALFFEIKNLHKSEKMLRSTKYFLSLKDFSM